MDLSFVVSSVDGSPLMFCVSIFVISFLSFSFWGGGALSLVAVFSFVGCSCISYSWFLVVEDCGRKWCASWLRRCGWWGDCGGGSLVL